MTNALYIHIPFCSQICHYCDFNKVYLKGQPVDDYLQALERELQLTVKRWPTTTLTTIFIGGGTPTALSEPHLQRLMELIHRHVDVSTVTEFTVEANPSEVSTEKLDILYRFGVNRLSFGVQTFDESLLKTIGRTHVKADIVDTVARAKQVGFTNISIDLMYNLPGQTMAQLDEAIDEAMKLDITHISAYSLLVEPRTVFYNLQRKGKLRLPGQDMEALMYERVMDRLSEQGYTQYEISNFARGPYESRHNQTYWLNEAYYGIGAGAHSYVAGARRSNIGPVNKYIQSLQDGQLPYLEEHDVTIEEAMEEQLFLGLRQMSGVSRTVFATKFNRPLDDWCGTIVAQLVEQQLLRDDGETISLTRQGRLLGNEVFQQFLAL